MHKQWNLLVCGLAAAFLCSPAHGWGLIPDYDFDWVTIGDLGNPGFEGGPVGQLAGRGSVGYFYRMSRTEVTVSQWFEFVQAYAPYAGEDASSFGFTGVFIQLVGPAGDPSSYQIAPGTENFPTNMSWRMAARYANWLHNGKKKTAEAFATGAYDTSTFTQNKDGTYNDQPTHSPGAKFWIPTLDEWMKGVYYDSNLNNGKGGWWHQPGSSNDALIAGLPWEAGQTNASLWAGPTSPPLGAMEVGQYPDVQSPWGLLDASGGMREWTEEFGSASHSVRLTKGSHLASDDYAYPWEDDILTLWPGAVSDTLMEGMRIVSGIPGPGSVWLLGLSCSILWFGRRKRCEERTVSESCSHRSRRSPAPTAG